MADFNQIIEESIEDNNTYHSVLWKADLIVEKVTIEPEGPEIGQVVTWEALIRNDGLGNAWDFRVAFDSDSDPGVNPLQTRLVELLGPSEKKSVQFNRKSSAAESDYWIMVDSQDTVSETNENNNVARTKISIADPS